MIKAILSILKNFFSLGEKVYDEQTDKRSAKVLRDQEEDLDANRLDSARSRFYSRMRRPSKKD